MTRLYPELTYWYKNMKVDWSKWAYNDGRTNADHIRETPIIRQQKHGAAKSCHLKLQIYDKSPYYWVLFGGISGESAIAWVRSSIWQMEIWWMPDIISPRLAYATASFLAPLAHPAAWKGHWSISRRFLRSWDIACADSLTCLSNLHNLSGINYS